MSKRLFLKRSKKLNNLTPLHDGHKGKSQIKPHHSAEMSWECAAYVVKAYINFF